MKLTPTTNKKGRFLSWLWNPLVLFCVYIQFILQGDVFSQAPQLYVEPGVHHSARSVAISPDRKYVAAGSLDRNIKVWSLTPPRELLTLPNEKESYSLAFHPTLPIIASANEDGTVTIWDFKKERLLASLETGGYGMPSVAFSKSGATLLCTNERFDIINRWEIPEFGELKPYSIRVPYNLTKLNLLDHGAMISGVDDKGIVRIYGTGNWKEICKIDMTMSPDVSVAFASKYKKLVTGDPNNGIRQWTFPGGKAVVTPEGAAVALEKQVHSVAFSFDEQLIACALESGDVAIFDSATLRARSRLRSYANRVEAAGLIEDNRMLAVQLWYDSIVVWDLSRGRPVEQGSAIMSSDDTNQWKSEGLVFDRLVGIEKNGDYVRINDQNNRELCTIVMLDKVDSWVVVAPDGRFDTNKDLSDIGGVHWIMSADSFNPLPLEILMRDYYEPGLLSRLLAGARFEAVEGIETLNQTQPKVEIVRVERQAQRDLVRVKVKVARAISKHQRDKRGRLLHTDVYDLRLFRNGQLVGQCPQEDTQMPTSEKRPAPQEQIGVWRQTALVKVRPNVRRAPDGSLLVTFNNIRMPRQADVNEVEFAAYAFNEDRVKSATAKFRFKLTQPRMAEKGKAYVIAVGVSAYEDATWDLQFAAEDARATAATLSAGLAVTGEYSEVVPVVLASEHTVRDGSRVVTHESASKASVRAVLGMLAGRGAPAGALGGVEGAERLRRVGPEDVVVIAFSSHGYTDAAGKFYLVPYDTGAPVRWEEGRIAEASLRHFISSDELGAWLRDVDAGELTLVVDTCHAAGAVDAEGFKPGPMGSRGMGQLAYDKGMRVLAASQADDVALEVGRLKHGLLTYALVREGLELGRADGDKDGRVTLEEWLRYGEERVPTLYEEVKAGKVKELRARDVEVVGVEAGASTSKAAFQKPSLFDFKRKKRLVPLKLLDDTPIRPLPST